MEIKLYRYLVIILVFVVLLLYYLFRSFIENFDKNTKTIFIVVIILTELNLLSIYWTLSNYEKNEGKVGKKGEKGPTGLPGDGGDPEVCNLCLKDEPTTTQSSKSDKVLLDILIISENTQKELKKKLEAKKIKVEGKNIKLQDYKVVNKYITVGSSGKFDALLAKYGKPTNKSKPITNLTVKEKGDECEDKIETSGNVQICIEKKEKEKPIVKITVDKKPNIENAMPLNYNLNSEESLYLNIEK